MKKYMLSFFIKDDKKRPSSIRQIEEKWGVPINPIKAILPNMGSDYEYYNLIIKEMKR